MAEKAYIVQETDEMTGGVIYAKTNAQARRRGANQFADDEFHGVICYRAPEFDGLKGDPRAQMYRLLARGWRFDTGSDLISEDDEPWVSKQGDVYKTPFEWLRERECAAERTRKQNEWLKELWSRWWFARDIHVHIEPRGYCDAAIQLPFLRDRLRFVERDGGRYSVTIRDLPIWRRAYHINSDAEVPGVSA